MSGFVAPQKMLVTDYYEPLTIRVAEREEQRPRLPLCPDTSWQGVRKSARLPTPGVLPAARGVFFFFFCVWGVHGHIWVLEAHTEEEGRRTDKRNSGCPTATLQDKRPATCMGNTCLPVGTPGGTAVAEGSELHPCCRRPTEQEDPCQACPGVAGGEVKTPPPNPTPITKSGHLVAKSAGADTSQHWCILTQDGSFSPVAPEVSVGFRNSGKRFEKLTLNICFSRARPRGCRGSGLAPQRLSVLSGQPGPSRGSDFTGLANKSRILSP